MSSERLSDYVEIKPLDRSYEAPWSVDRLDAASSMPHFSNEALHLGLGDEYIQKVQDLFNRIDGNQSN